MHHNDKTLTCSRCGKKVFIPFNQVGGFWYLNSYKGVDGKLYHGGHCPECFDEISNLTEVRA